MLSQNGQTFKFFDGGLGANNPTTQAYNTVRLYFNRAEHFIGPVVSVGTGIVERRKSRSPLWGKPRSDIEMIINAATNSEDTHTNMADALPEKSYYRFNVDSDLGYLKLDSWKGKSGEETRRIMREATRKYLERTEIRNAISECANQLVAVRRARAQSVDPSRWEEFCHGVSYRCEFADCHEGHPAFTAAADFQSHLKTAHPNLAADQKAFNDEFDAGKAYPLYPDTA